MAWLDYPKRFSVHRRRCQMSRFERSRDANSPSITCSSERWMGYTANNRECALLLRHPQPRPWLVCVHGTEMGRAALDLALFRACRLHEDLSRTERCHARPPDARPPCPRPVEGRGVSRGGHPRRRACDGPGRVGHPAAVVLDTSAGAGVADRVERSVTGRLHRRAGGQPRNGA
jgi:hypothetical protein